MSVSFSELTDLVVVTRHKLSARCADCVHVSEIDWSRGFTRLSGYCPIGEQRLINHNGGRGSLHQQRKCFGFELSSATDQAERVERKVQEAEAALDRYLHSSHVTSSVSGADRVASEQRPAVGTAENRLTADPNKAQFSRTR